MNHAQKRYAKVWEARRPLIEEYCRQGLSLAHMANLLGANRRHVRTAIVRWKIPYQRYSQAGSNNPAWRGGVRVDADGYVLVYAPDHPRATHGKVRRHRLIMEQKIGRLLLPHEVVYHKDKNKLNNAPENLELYQNNAAHLAVELKGKCPDWTEDGKRRIRAALQKPGDLRWKYNRQRQAQASSAIHTASGTDGLVAP
jgi:hypothetical protein